MPRSANQDQDSSSFESDSYDCGRAETCVAESGNPILLTELVEPHLAQTNKCSQMTFLEMEVLQLNATLDDLQSSLEIHKSILDNVLNGCADQAIEAAYKEI